MQGSVYSNKRPQTNVFALIVTSYCSLSSFLVQLTALSQCYACTFILTLKVSHFEI